MNLQKDFRSAVQEENIDFTPTSINFGGQEDQLCRSSRTIGDALEMRAARPLALAGDWNGYEAHRARGQNKYPDYTLQKEDANFNIQRNDELLEIEGIEVEDRSSVEEVINGRDNEEEIECTVERNDSLETISAYVAELRKIAVDVKTTYYEVYQRDYGDFIEGDMKTIKFTLGSHGSYLQDNTSGIEYDYRCYSKHYIIGFLYRRNNTGDTRVSLDKSNSIEPPIRNVKYFVQEKYKIAGEKKGSGDTQNIGSISTNDIQDFREGNGPFADKGEDLFREYWKNHAEYKDTKEYSDVEGFLEWRQDTS